MKYQGTEAECRELARIGDKLDGAPRRGVHVGGGLHVDMPEAWDGEGKVPPGWTSLIASVAAVEDAPEQFQVEVDETALTERAGLLTLSERTFAEIAIAQAVKVETEPEAPAPAEPGPSPVTTGRVVGALTAIGGFGAAVASAFGLVPLEFGLAGATAGAGALGTLLPQMGAPK